MPQNLSIFSFLLYHPAARHRHSGFAGTSALSIWLSVDPMADKYPELKSVYVLRRITVGTKAHKTLDIHTYKHTLAQNLLYKWRTCFV